MAVKVAALSLLLAVVSLTTVAGAITKGNRAFECPESYGNYPHSLYCNLYWQCRSGEAYLFECPFDWLFSSKLAVCDLPKNVDCGNLIVPGTKPPTDPTSSISTTTESIRETTTELRETTEQETTTTPTTTTTTPEPTSPGPFVCPSQDGSFPNPASCESYYQCVAGVAFLQNCAPGTWFNPTTGSCEFPGSFCEPPRTNRNNQSAKDKVHELIRRGMHPRVPRRQERHDVVLGHRRVRT